MEAPAAREAENGSQRLGAISAVAGVLALLVGTIPHPSGADPNVPIAAFSEYAASRSWVAIHLVRLAGILLMVFALISPLRFLEQTSVGAPYERIPSAPVRLLWRLTYATPARNYDVLNRFAF